MKKILYTLIGIAGLSLASCDMDKYPYNEIPTDEALRTLSDFKNFRNGFYEYTQVLFTGSYVLQPEIQADGLNAVIDFSNTYGTWYRWQQTAEDGGQWSGFYALISNCNLVLEKGVSLMHTFSDADQITLKHYLGEAYFMRALAYEELAIRFCKPYNASTAANDLGVALVTKYAPSSQSSTYPARSSLAKTYELITADLDSAAKYITTPGTQNSGYLTEDAVAALKARVALQMKDYTAAINAAKPLVDGDKYPLVTTAVAMKDMWTNDKSTEVIFQPVFKAGQLGSATGTVLIDKSGSNTKLNPDFLPTETVLNLYDNKDIRFATYFKPGSITFSSGTATLYYCNKYPGNPAYCTGNTQFVNAPKIFRVAEMYLILAEAYKESNDETNALIYLNALRSKRIADYVNQTYTGNVLTDEIRKERQREFYMEGYRLWDLKRYGIGLSGRTPQDGTYVYLNGNDNTINISKEATDFRFVWPIPSHEINANPQIKNQQNEGY